MTRPQWQALPGAELDTQRDPWLLWALRRPGNERRLHCLNEGERPAQTTAWHVPAVYPPGCRYFSAHRPNTGTAPPALAGARRTVLSSGTLALQPQPGVDPARSAASAMEAPPRTPPASGQPVLGLIDGDIALLHRQFRGKDGRARIRHFWDQGLDAGQAPWRMPADLGYGRELDAAAIEALGPLPDAHAEARAYRSLGHASRRWGHGTQTLGLAAATIDPLSGLQDEASSLDIVAVQLPAPAFADTHGNWLNCCVLDGLRYLLARTDPAAALVVSISLGAHSGPHDGTGLLEQAIDALIEEQGGRLTVVIAAGNSRLARAHASFELPAAQAGQPSQHSLWIDMPYDDESPNYLECWIDGLAAEAAAGQFSISVTPEGGPAGVLSSAAVPQARALQLDAASPPLALLHLAAANGSVHRPTGLHAWLGIAAHKVRPPQPGPGCLWGRWCVTLSNHSEQALRVNSWIARDDLADLGRSAARLAKPFAERTAAALITETGTLSNLASSRRSIVVGAYEYETERKSYRMWPHSAAGAPPEQRGPDLCGPGAMRTEKRRVWLGAMGFFSPEPLAPLLDPCEAARSGTSLAAPIVARRLACVLHQQGAALDKAALLQALQRRWPSVPLPSELPAAWIGRYWLPMPALP